MPHYPQSSEFNQIPASAPMQVPVQPEGFYSPASCPPKPTVCLAYPVQAVQPVHHVPQNQHVSTAQPTSTPVQGPPNLQNGPIQGNNQILSHSQPRSAPSTSPRSSTAGSSESGMQNNQPHNMNYAENVYPGAMVTGPPAYVIPSMGIPYAPSLPAYDGKFYVFRCNILKSYISQQNCPYSNRFVYNVSRICPADGSISLCCCSATTPTRRGPGLRTPVRTHSSRLRPSAADSLLYA